MGPADTPCPDLQFHVGFRSDLRTFSRKAAGNHDGTYSARSCLFTKEVGEKIHRESKTWLVSTTDSLLVALLEDFNNDGPSAGHDLLGSADLLGPSSRRTQSQRVSSAAYFDGRVKAGMSMHLTAQSR